MPMLCPVICIIMSFFTKRWGLFQNWCFRNDRYYYYYIGDWTSLLFLQNARSKRRPGLFTENDQRQSTFSCSYYYHSHRSNLRCGFFVCVLSLSCCWRFSFVYLSRGCVLQRVRDSCNWNSYVTITRENSYTFFCIASLRCKSVACNNNRTTRNKPIFTATGVGPPSHFPSFLTV